MGVTGAGVDGEVQELPGRTAPRKDGATELNAVF